MIVTALPAIRVPQRHFATPRYTRRGTGDIAPRERLVNRPEQAVVGHALYERLACHETRQFHAAVLGLLALIFLSALPVWALRARRRAGTIGGDQRWPRRLGWLVVAEAGLGLGCSSRWAS